MIVWSSKEVARKRRRKRFLRSVFWTLLFLCVGHGGGASIAAIVFTDTFTVGADTNINVYPSAGDPDYAYNNGSGANLTVNAANDRVQSPNTASTYKARIIDASVPTGDQEVIATCFNNTGFNSGGVAVRLNTAGTDNGYLSYIEQGVTNEVRIIKVIDGSETVIATWDKGLSGATSHRRYEGNSIFRFAGARFRFHQMPQRSLLGCLICILIP